MNKSMVPVAGECSLQEALWMITLLETRRIIACFDLVPDNLSAYGSMMGYVVVAPEDFNTAKSLLADWDMEHCVCHLAS